jgi:hypothetical protein
MKTSRQGGELSLGPAVEAGKLCVQEIIAALKIVDPIEAAAGKEQLLNVHAMYALDGPPQPVISAGTKWRLFNFLAEKLNIGYSLYVTQAVFISVLVLGLVTTVVAVPLIMVKRSPKLPAEASVVTTVAATSP